MSKKEFVRAIGLLKEARDRDQKLYELGITLEDDCPLWRLSDQVVRLLEEIAPPSKQDMISWFCWDRQFGAEDCRVWNGETVIAEVNTPEKLYDYLMEG